MTTTIRIGTLKFAERREPCSWCKGTGTLFNGIACPTCRGTGKFEYLDQVIETGKTPGNTNDTED